MTSSENTSTSNNENADDSTTTSSTTATSTTTTNNGGDEKVTDNNRKNSLEMSAIELEYIEISAKNAWPIFYQFIRNESSDYKFSFEESKKAENRHLNRYRDVSPYDHTRVILKRSSCDYINANIVQVEKANRKYILTQGPLPITAGHFWLMVWEQNSKAIIMLNKIVEKTTVKCHQYWPTDETADTLTFPDVELKVEFVSKTSKTDYTTTTLRLTDIASNESREILHFHYITWPDFGVPQSPTAFLRFLADVRLSGVLEPNVGPPVVHCSAGIGRSGTFCLVDTCLVLIEKGEKSVRLREILMEMRKSRMGLIQTPDQLRFSYVAIIEASKQLPLTNTIRCDDSVYNDYDKVTAFNSSQFINEDELPPLPPPRSASLGGHHLDRSSSSSEEESFPKEPVPNSRNKNTSTNPPNKPLPCEPPRGVNSNHVNNDDDTSSADPSTSSDLNELRQRRRNEKKERLHAHVQEIKRKREEAEEWEEFKRSLFTPLTVGAAIIGGGVLIVYGYYYLRG